MMVAFIDEHRDSQGVAPICEVLPIAPSTYYENKAQAKNPERRSARAKRDEELKGDIKRVWEGNRAPTDHGRFGGN
jgi:putative transposase